MNEAYAHITYICMYICMRIYVSVYTYVAGCTRPIRILHMYACIYVCVLYSRPMQILHIYACIYVCLYMHLYMFML